MKLSVTRTIPGKYSSIGRNGDLYFTDDEEVEVEYYYGLQDLIEFLFDYEDKYIKAVIISLIENPDSIEELVAEEYAEEFAKWFDKERKE